MQFNVQIAVQSYELPILYKVTVKSLIYYREVSTE